MMSSLYWLIIVWAHWILMTTAYDKDTTGSASEDARRNTRERHPKGQQDTRPPRRPRQKAAIRRRKQAMNPSFHGEAAPRTPNKRRRRRKRNRAPTSSSSSSSTTTTTPEPSMSPWVHHISPDVTISPSLVSTATLKPVKISGVNQAFPISPDFLRPVPSSATMKPPSEQNTSTSANNVTPSAAPAVVVSGSDIPPGALTGSPTTSPTLSPSHAVLVPNKPLKVFIIAGQSNAVGMGSIKHLDRLVTRNCSRSSSSNSSSNDVGGGGGCNEYQKALWSTYTNSYKVNHNVFVNNLHYHVGELTVFDDFYDDAINEKEYYNFGPDLMFGWTVQETVDEPIAIIKTAWGGVSLGVDFRPPSSGMGNFPGIDVAEYGVYYRMMLSEISDSLSILDTWVPSYNPANGYELAGFVWFQGYNDVVDSNYVLEYGNNLANLIRDLRYNLGAEDMPFVVGELGMHGADESLFPQHRNASERIKSFRSAQYTVTMMDEFRSNTLFVRTAPYVVLNGEQFDTAYHYGGRADTFFHIGQAFGRGMLHLLGYHVTESPECKCTATETST